MAKLVLVAIILSLTACGGWRTKIDQVQVPVLVCPKPPEIKRPELEIYKLTDEDMNDPGKVAQAVKITLVQLQSYGILLETVLETYKNTSEAYDDLRQELENRFPEVTPEE